MPECPHTGMPSLQDIEANLLKQDIAKAKQKEQTDQPAAVAKALELNDAAAMRRRGRMMLPAPQVHAHTRRNHSSPLQLCSALKTAGGNCMPAQLSDRCLALQVTDQELEAIARGEGAAGMDMDTDGAGGDATRRLLGDYQTPARYTADCFQELCAQALQAWASMGFAASSGVVMYVILLG